MPLFRCLLFFAMATVTLAQYFSQCEDVGNYLFCYMASMTGQCYDRHHINSMIRMCRSTCNLCHMPLPTQKPVPVPCKDNTSKCKRWVQYCKEGNPWYGYMSKNCKVTCALCSQCEDSHGSCSVYQRRGYCEPSSVYIKFMRRRCTKTCALCKDVTSTAVPTTPSPTPPEIKEFECNFGENECDWWNEPLDDTADWIVGTIDGGLTEGARYDLSRGVAGNYLYLDASYPTQKASIRLPWAMILPMNTTTREQMCFKLHYHLTGGHFSILQSQNAKLAERNIYGEAAGSSPSRVITRRNPTRGWVRLHVNVNVGVDSTIIIEGTKGEHGDVALDSFYFVKGVCP